jgi:hypothetical protein
VARGKEEYTKLFSDLGALVEDFKHHHAYINWIIQGDMVVAEGSSEGKLKSGECWSDSKMAVLMYDDLRQKENPREALMDYLESAYQAGAKRANWNIGEFDLRANIAK